MELPEPRGDGACCRCVKRPAVTNDGRFCKQCLGAIVREMTPSTRDLSRRGTDEIGRRARASQTLSGAPDMQTEDTTK